MQLSPHFTLAELTASQTAFRRGIDNTPNEMSIANLRELCENVLEPIRNHFGKPLIISSGYRNAKVCEAIGSSARSQHTASNFDAAADFGVVHTPFLDVAKYIRDNLVYDQLILEGPPGRMWVHVSYASNRPNRKMYGVYDGRKYTWGTLKL